MRYAKIVNLSHAAVLAKRAVIADTSALRRRGLLGCDELPQGSGLIIIPCRQVHTFGMKYPIDVVFLDASWQVRRCAKGLKPWRLSPLVISSRSVLELPAGKISETGTEAGDTLRIVPLG